MIYDDNPDAACAAWRHRRGPSRYPYRAGYLQSCSVDSPMAAALDDRVRGGAHHEIAIRRSGRLVQGGNIAWHLIWFYPVTLTAGLALIIFLHFALKAAWLSPS